MDPTLDLERRRLLISAALTAHARRRLGSSLAANLSVGELLDLACGVSEGAGTIERAYRLRFDPPYPGVTAGPQSVRRTSKLMLACSVRDRVGTPIGVVFTTLIAGLPRCRWRLPERAFPKVGGRRGTFTETPRHSTGVADGPTTILRDPSSD